MTPVLKSGCLAYFDAFTSGIVKCKILSIVRKEDGIVVEARLTETVGPWKRGEIIHRSVHSFFPRKALKKSGYHLSIAAHDIELDPENAE